VNVAAETPAARPVDGAGRIPALDALRGVALLGILWANVRQLLMPWDIADFPVSFSQAGESFAWADWLVFDALIDLKFLTLFSLLFGVGFALQAERLTDTGRDFKWIYARRVLLLAVFGIAHALLLYPAEVLFPYAVAGLLLLGTRRWSTRALVATGLWLLSVTLLASYQLGSLGMAFPIITAAAALSLAAVLYALREWPWWANATAAAAIVALAAIVMTLGFHAGNPEPLVPAEYAEARQQLAAIVSGDEAQWPGEYRVRRQGSLLDLVLLHAQQYALILTYFLVLLLWRTLGLFMIGAALHRSGIFARDSAFSWPRAARIGLALGLVLSALATSLHALEIHGAIDWRWPKFLHELSALPLAAGIAGLVVSAVEGGAARWLMGRIESAGRMALTNYVGQSLVVCACAESWGLGRYGTLDGPAMTLLAVAVFAALALASHAWLARFSMGPLEWLWRCGTYSRWLPLTRATSS
jgi:uncharacterized protein